ncbi:MAG: putative toxin-antitoxin system toxin component, PIN family [Verrucomicrobiae bacterium]|nr:putative toxin-antitoxin system toxin component, PIN family [Verrucomicrobiae bacterium]
MRVCIDTNALVQLFGRTQSGRPIREALLAGRIELAISNEILLEYQETITLLSGEARWQLVERFLTLLFHLHANVLFIEPHFRFAIITADPDDNKFSDCAIAAQADCIITSDRHFDALKGSGYKPRPFTPEEFVRRHL